jgi:sensor histidine kinase regulating citrate/malate metabolism
VAVTVQQCSVQTALQNNRARLLLLVVVVLVVVVLTHAMHLVRVWVWQLLGLCQQWWLLL